MTDRYEEIRKALAMGPTPGEWYWTDAYPTQDGRKTWSLIGDGGFGILSCDGEENSPQSVNAAAADWIVACDPDTIQALLDECDALRGEVAEWKSVAVAQSTEIERLRAEVSELRAARIAYASEFPETKDGGPDTGNIHTNIRSLKARAERLAEVLSKILENEASDWKVAEEFGGYVLDDELREEARAALAKENE